ncbi:MAG: hypothetical protein ACE5G0_14415 [Rhodothermales bacterium]
MRHLRWASIFFILLNPIDAYSQTDAGYTVTEYIEKADSARAVRQFKEELTILNAATDVVPGNAPILWRLTRAYVEFGGVAEKKKDKRFYFQEAMESGQQAIAADSMDFLAYTWLAIAEGTLASVESKKAQVKLAWQIREHAERAITLNPDHDTAYHVLARWHHEVASIGGFRRTLAKLFIGSLPEASYEEAIEHYKHAIALVDLIHHRLELAKTYLKSKRQEEARVELEHILTMPNEKRLDYEFKDEARHLLEDLK